MPRAGRATVAEAIGAAAVNSFDPVKRYLDGLAWDGHKRLGFWLVDYCAAPDTAFNREAGFRWMFSAVARVQEPGCKVDAMLVLEGDQGAGKSSALRVLAGSAHFGDALPDPMLKDASLYLRGRWIVEFAELASFRTADTEVLKAFISRTEERYRPA